MFFSTQPHTASSQPQQQHAAHATTLRPGQIRIINASEGLTLKVLQGRMWVTRPDDPRDHFLAPGTELALTQNQVVVEPDHAVGGGQVSEVRYVLLPTVRPRNGAAVHAAPAATAASTAPRVAGARLGQAVGQWYQHIFSRKNATTA